jgi:hypothetical protein
MATLFKVGGVFRRIGAHCRELTHVVFGDEYDSSGGSRSWPAWMKVEFFNKGGIAMSQQSDEQAINVLSRMLEQATDDQKADKGACVYTAGTKTYCAVLTKSQCDGLKGAWTKGGKCPKT